MNYFLRIWAFVAKRSLCRVEPITCSVETIDKAHVRQRQYFDCLDSRNLCLASLEKRRKLLMFNFRGGIWYFYWNNALKSYLVRTFQSNQIEKIFIFDKVMAIFSSTLNSALDRSATFLTVLAGLTVKNRRSPRGPRFEPGWPQSKNT